LKAAPSAGVTVEAPCRADLAGGTLDIWPLGALHPGSMTVNAAIPMMVRLTLEFGEPDGELRHTVRGTDEKVFTEDHAATDLSAAIVFFFRPEGGVRVRVDSQASVGSGLGGSSTYAVALAKGILAADGAEVSDARLVRVLRDLEARVLRAPTGVQDHWAALTGGLSAIHLLPGDEGIERLDVDPGWIGGRMTIFDTGISHHSGMVNWQVIRRRLEGEPETISALDGIAEAAAECRTRLLAEDGAGVGRAIAAEWTHRRRLAPEVCPPEISEVERAALEAGATAIKACGAGGGGSVLVWHEPECGPSVTTALETAAPRGRVVATGIVERGCHVTVS